MFRAVKRYFVIHFDVYLKRISRFQQEWKHIKVALSKQRPLNQTRHLNMSVAGFSVEKFSPKNFKNNINLLDNFARRGMNNYFVHLLFLFVYLRFFKN